MQYLAGMKEQSFTLILKEELQKRKSKNPGYSLRAFAKSLGLSSSFVSKVLNAKKNVSRETALTIASRLNIDEEVMQIVFSDAPNFKLKQMEFDTVAVDEFHFISDWHHFAILESVTLADFQVESRKKQIKWFAERLSITEDRAGSAVERLERLKLLSTDENGNILGIEKNNTAISSQVPTSANREHERQILEKAIEALERTPFEHRSQSSMMMAIPASRVDEAKEKIKTFRREMSTFLQRKGKRDSIYQLSISFFPLTKIESKK